MADAAKVVLKEGAETFGVTHLATLQEGAGDEATEEVVSEALMDAALVFAGYLHKNAEPMFLHSLRAFLEYQDYACAGCKASTTVVIQAIALKTPTKEQLASLTATNVGEDEELPDDKDITERLMEAMRAVEAGVPIHEALASIGGRVILTDEAVGDDADEG